MGNIKIDQISLMKNTRSEIKRKKRNNGWVEVQNRDDRRR